MRPSSPLLNLIAAAALLVIPVMAGEITFTAENSDYYVPLGQQAAIPITVMSSFDHNIDGTIQFTTIEQLQNTGTVMTSTKNRVYSDTVTPGSSQMTLDGGTSSVEKSLKVQITYDYTDGSPVQITMPEIVIHFVSQVPQSQGSNSPVTSTSGPGTGTVPASSSVQIVQQSVSVQQQAGRDGALQNSQQVQDANALKEQLQREAEKTQQDKAAFEDALSRDPLLASVNESLAADGFTRQSLSSNPASGASGSFSMEYRNAAGESATVAGTMENGAVPSVHLQSAAPFNVTAPLATNATFTAMSQQLIGHGYQRNSTSMDVTASGAMINITFQNPQGKQGFINATTDTGNVTSISLETEKEVPFDYLPLAAGVIAGAVAIIAAWVVYRNLRNRAVRPVLSDAREDLYEEPFDHRKAARELLAQAEAAYRHGMQADACGLAGQAFRLFISCENGVRRELTNAELIALMRSRGMDTRTIEEDLMRCTDVEFARGMVDDETFAALAASIRSRIENTR